MEEDFEKVKKALRLQRDFAEEALGEYISFLRSLREMKPHFERACITFELADAEVPDSIVFQTPAGEIQAARLVVLDGKDLVNAVVFTEASDPASKERTPDLWSVLLRRWGNPWKDLQGQELERDFSTDQVKPHLVLDAVLTAVAQKVLRNTERISPK